MVIAFRLTVIYVIVSGYWGEYKICKYIGLSLQGTNISIHFPPIKLPQVKSLRNIATVISGCKMLFYMQMMVSLVCCLYSRYKKYIFISFGPVDLFILKKKKKKAICNFAKQI